MKRGRRLGAAAPAELKLSSRLADNSALVDPDKLRLIDASGDPITVVDENGVTVGNIDVA
jgi:hypothetical protein